RGLATSLFACVLMFVTAMSTLSLHDALPIYQRAFDVGGERNESGRRFDFFTFCVIRRCQAGQQPDADDTYQPEESGGQTIGSTEAEIGGHDKASGRTGHPGKCDLCTDDGIE